MLAPNAARPHPSTSGAAQFAAGVSVPVPTRTPKPTKRLPGRGVTSREQRSPGGREGAISAVSLRRQVMNAINNGTLRLDAGNMLLRSLNQRPLKGGRQVAFRVHARLRAPYGGPAAMIAYANAVIVDEMRLPRWTRLDGCPEGYAIDEPVVDGDHGRLCATVHTTMRLTVDVPAYPEHALEATARDLLHLDLGSLHRVEPEPTRITVWEEAATSWDEFVVETDLECGGWPVVLG